MGQFIVKRNNKLEEYSRYEDIPDDFDHLIKFSPEYIEPPHTDEQHEELESWNEKLQLLIRKENARSNKNR